MLDSGWKRIRSPDAIDSVRFDAFMPKITSIRPQKRNKERVNVYVDDAFAMGLALNAALDLRIGTEFTPDLQQQLEADDEIEVNRQRVINLISYRPRSIEEVRRNLRRKEVDDEVIEHIISEFVEKGILDDAAFADYWIEQRETFKPRGPQALRYELRQKGVDPQVIEPALSDLDELDNARRAAAKRANRFAGLDWQQFRKKLSGHLQRRGFRYEVIRQVVEENWNNISTSTLND
jgi:regulatory protein